MYSFNIRLRKAFPITTTTTTVLRPFVQDYPGEPAAAAAARWVGDN